MSDGQLNHFSCITGDPREIDLLVASARDIDDWNVKGFQFRGEARRMNGGNDSITGPSLRDLVIFI